MPGNKKGEEAHEIITEIFRYGEKKVWVAGFESFSILPEEFANISLTPSTLRFLPTVAINGSHVVRVCQCKRYLKKEKKKPQSCLHKATQVIGQNKVPSCDNKFSSFQVNSS